MNELPGWLKHTTVWLLLGLMMFLGVQAWQARERQTRFSFDGQTVEMRRAADGHYHWVGRLAGREVEFLVDTGATRTAIPMRLAEQLGLPSVGTTQSATAGGTVQGQIVVGTLELDGGVRAERLHIVALPQLHAPLLGMDVLGRLAWQQDRGVLRIDLGGALMAGLHAACRGVGRAAFLVLALTAGAASAEVMRSVLPAVAPPPPASAPAARYLCPPALPQASAAELAAAARDRGLLWRATRDGRVLHLYGTLHVGKPHWKKLGPRTSAALRDSDVLALEIDPLDPALGAAMAELAHPRQFTPAMRQRLDLAYRRACMAPEALATLHPLLQVTTLTVMEARWFGMDPAYSAELTLAGQSRNGSRKLVALETPAVQIRAIVPAEESEAQAMFEQGLEQLENQSARRVLQKLATAWEKGDLATLEDTTAWCECQLSEADRALMARLTDARNAALAAGIVAQHRAGKRVFAAVGALHMAGPHSLPRLLEKQGFKVERVRF